MKLDTVTIGGFMRFTEPVTLDLRDVPPGLVAITGANGEGKSSLLEAPLAALFRSFPSRSELINYATGRDAFLEATFSTAAGAYRARVNVDGIRRTTDAVLAQTVNGHAHATCLNDGKATTYDQQVRQRFPSQDLMLASCFAAQNQAGNFISRKPAQRRELFGELLGLTALTTMGQTARQLATLVEQATGRLVSVHSLLLAETRAEAFDALDTEDAAQADALAQAVARKAALTLQVADLEARLATMQDAVTAHAVATERVQRLTHDLRAREQERAQLLQDRDVLQAAYRREGAALQAKLDATLADIDTKLAGNAQIQSMADDIRTAVDRVMFLDSTITVCRDDLDAASAAHSAAVVALTEAERALVGLATVEQQQQRATADAALLDTVPCGGEGPYAACGFLVNAQQARAQLAAYVTALEPKAALADRVGACTRQRDLAADRIGQAKAQLAAATAERAPLAKTAAYAGKLEASEARVAELQAQRSRATADAAEAIDALRARYERADADLGRRLTVLQGAAEDLTRALAEAERALSDVADRHTEAAGVQVQLQQARGEVERTVARIATSDATRQEYARRRRVLTTKLALRQDTKARIAALDTELLEWQLLAKALGKDGLPDLEIDAAGPTISAYTNELLEVCHGTRFSLELVTQVAKADGKGMRDEFTVRVTDNASGGTSRDIADLSGGEQVIVSEALRNAIAVYVNQRAPMPIRTCWRDETTGALDPENAQRYLAMLRKVQALAGYAHILFVSHNPAVSDLADARVHIADGALTVSLQGARQEAA